MYLDKIGEVIAVRELYIADKQRQKKTIVVSLGKPQMFPDVHEHYCPFQISGVGAEKIKYASGIDAMQALQLALVMIGASLRFLNEKTGGNLKWEGGNEGDFGFPSEA